MISYWKKISHSKKHTLVAVESETGSSNTAHIKNVLLSFLQLLWDSKQVTPNLCKVLIGKYGHLNKAASSDRGCKSSEMRSLS